ncbi:Spy/CpxP family protein refolding chaperone [Pseudoalteromonas xiamenensis]|uniref:Spy/CpxP family protein refolding chaperone n=1 Tax=Pseudoalteromonas xiamenensis TaxID=882626 RepID=UPI0035EF750E
MNAKKVMLAVLVGVGLTMAQGAVAKPERGGPDAFLLQPRLAEKLGLSDEQKAQIKKIFEDNKTVRDSLGGDRRVHAEQFKALMNSPTFDEAKARAILEGEQSERLEMHIQQLKARHQVLQVLTQEQRDKLQELHQIRAEKRQKGHRHEG